MHRLKASGMEDLCVLRGHNPNHVRGGTASQDGGLSSLGSALFFPFPLQHFLIGGKLLGACQTRAMATWAPAYRASCDGYIALMKKEPRTGKPASGTSCFLSIQMGIYREQKSGRNYRRGLPCWAPESPRSFPMVFQSRTWSRGFALFTLCPGFGFAGEGHTPLPGAPR